MIIKPGRGTRVFLDNLELTALEPASITRLEGGIEIQNGWRLQLSMKGERKECMLRAERHGREVATVKLEVVDIDEGARMFDAERAADISGGYSSLYY